jgi:hypothetical protein
MADVRPRIHIIDWGRDIELFHWENQLSAFRIELCSLVSNWCSVATGDRGSLSGFTAESRWLQTFSE